MLVCFPPVCSACRAGAKNASPANLRGAGYVSNSLQAYAHPWDVSGKSHEAERIKPGLALRDASARAWRDAVCDLNCHLAA
jgi:hypothetical protein